MPTFASLAGLLAAGFLLIAYVAQPSARMADAAVVPAAAADVTLVGHIGGAVTAIARSGNLAFIGEGPALAILDVTDPAAPVSIGRSSILPGVVGASR